MQTPCPNFSIICVLVNCDSCPWRAICDGWIITTILRYMFVISLWFWLQCNGGGVKTLFSLYKHSHKWRMNEVSMISLMMMYWLKDYSQLKSNEWKWHVVKHFRHNMWSLSWNNIITFESMIYVNEWMLGLRQILSSMS